MYQYQSELCYTKTRREKKHNRKHNWLYVLWSCPSHKSALSKRYRNKCHHPYCFLLATYTETILDVSAKMDVPFLREQLVVLWEHLCWQERRTSPGGIIMITWVNHVLTEPIKDFPAKSHCRGPEISMHCISANQQPSGAAPRWDKYNGTEQQ